MNKEYQKVVAKRLKELKIEASKVGCIQQISKLDYKKEVTAASESATVICCLFVDGQEESKKMLNCLGTLAEKFKYVKFVKIAGSECVANYPDNFCPTLLIYKDGDSVGNIKGLYQFGGKNGISANSIEWQLSRKGIIQTDLQENPLKFTMKRGKDAQLNSYGGNKRGKLDDSDEDDMLDVD